jgi:hypothetical protein
MHQLVWVELVVVLMAQFQLQVTMQLLQLEAAVVVEEQHMEFLQ